MIALKANIKLGGCQTEIKISTYRGCELFYRSTSLCSAWV